MRKGFSISVLVYPRSYRGENDLFLLLILSSRLRKGPHNKRQINKLEHTNLFNINFV